MWSCTDVQMETAQKAYNYFLFIIFAITSLCYFNIRLVNGEEDFLLTKWEKEALDQLKTRVVHELPQDHMKQEIFLIRWLRARNFDVQRAERMLLEDIRWRKENRIDTILEEDWSDMTEFFPVDELTFDKSGRPIRQLDVETWNVRKNALAGKSQRMYKYLVRMLEEATQEVVHQQHRGHRNVTQWKLLVNLEGFNLIWHACPLCLSSYIQLVLSYEEHYPGSADGLIFINMPASFRIVLDAIRPLFSAPTRKAFKTFGFDKKRWMEFLHKDIDPDQLGIRFGGTRKTQK